VICDVIIGGQFEGWKVAIADIKENPGFAEELGQASTFHTCDVADYDRCVFLILLRRRH
jgi:hypothetical protein